MSRKRKKPITAAARRARADRDRQRARRNLVTCEGCGREQTARPPQGDAVTPCQQCGHLYAKYAYAA